MHISPASSDRARDYGRILYPVVQKGKWGFIDRTGRIIIEPKFRDVQPFCNNRAVFLSDNSRYGFIDEKGSIIIPPVYDFAFNFSEGCFAVVISEDVSRRQAGESTFIDENGRYLFKPRVNFRFFPFREGLSRFAVDCKITVNPVSRNNFYYVQEVLSFRYGKYGFADKSGNIIIKPEFKYASDFSEGLEMVMINGKCGFINKTGTIIIQPVYDYAGSFNNGLAYVSYYDNNAYKRGYVDKTGKLIIEQRPDSFIIGDNKFSEGLAVVQGKNSDGHGYGFGYIDTNGKLIIDIRKFDNCCNFNEGLAAASFRKQWGYIDKNGKWKITPKYAYAYPFSNGLAPVLTEDSNLSSGRAKLGYIDKNGDYIWKPSN